MRSILVDAGPQVALFAADDKHHEHYDALLRRLSVHGLRLLTTWPCVVEASHLLSPEARYRFLKWIEAGGVLVCPFEKDVLSDLVEWMKTYTERGKREMDLADATLYWLATETGLREIMSVDRRDFSRYRLPDGQGFSIL